MQSQTIAPPYRVAAGEGLTDVWWKTGRITVKVGRAETADAFAQVETDDPRGTATPLHVHMREDETFYVLEGEVTLFVGGERVDMSAGDFAFAPRGIAHAYVVRSDRARMLTTFSPGGFEEVFAAQGVPAEGETTSPGDVLPPPAEMARVFGRYGIEIVGPPPALEDLD